MIEGISVGAVVLRQTLPDFGGPTLKLVELVDQQFETYTKPGRLTENSARPMSAIRTSNLAE